MIYSKRFQPDPKNKYATWCYTRLHPEFCPIIAYKHSDMFQGCVEKEKACLYLRRFGKKFAISHMRDLLGLYESQNNERFIVSLIEELSRASWVTIINAVQILSFSLKFRQIPYYHKNHLILRTVLADRTGVNYVPEDLLSNEFIMFVIICYRTSSKYFPLHMLTNEMYNLIKCGTIVDISPVSDDLYDEERLEHWDDWALCIPESITRKL